eukprot:6198579-Pleurochrysis_carterae.AAC.1
MSIDHTSAAHRSTLSDVQAKRQRIANLRARAQCVTQHLSLTRQCQASVRFHICIGLVFSCAFIFLTLAKQFVLPWIQRCDAVNYESGVHKVDFNP